MPHESRHYRRIRVPEKHSVACEGIDRPLAGEVTVMGLGGLFIRSRDTYPVGTVFSVRFKDDGEIVEATCAVRDQEAQGIGVEFVQLRGQNEENLKKIVQRLSR
jgi:hypothetical protein